jgi:hypothetical protein
MTSSPALLPTAPGTGTADTVAALSVRLKDRLDTMREQVQ